MDSLKRLLLDEAGRKDLHLVHQLDGWVLAPGAGDDFMHADEAGDALTGGESYEFRRSGPELAVRVQVHAGTSPVVAVRVLRKITAWLERDPRLIEDRPIEAPELEEATTVAKLSGVSIAATDCVRLLRVANAAECLRNRSRPAPDLGIPF